MKATDVPELKAFLDDIEAVCRKHNLSISHEDGHGAFHVEDASDFNIGWLRDAFDHRAETVKREREELIAEINKHRSGWPL